MSTWAGYLLSAITDNLRGARSFPGSALDYCISLVTGLFKNRSKSQAVKS